MNNILIVNAGSSSLKYQLIDMTEIHSRPLKDSPWCYVFYVDFTGNMRDHAVQSLLYQLHEELPYIKVIGSYCVPNE